MEREYCKATTKQELIEMGIKDVYWDNEANNWAVIREWYKNNSKTKTVCYKMFISTVTAKHKYGKTKQYPKLQLSYKGKALAIPLSRFIYAWFVEDIPAGYVIDHVDNDPFNNTIENLKMLTIEENLAKRYIDNPNGGRNQWSYMDDFDKACDLFQRRSKKRMKEIKDSLNQWKKEIEEIKNR